MRRRSFLAGAASAALLAARRAFGDTGDNVREIRIGYQKSSLLAIVKQQRIIERRMNVRWIEFSHGPPLLEALGAGRIDYGNSGNAPPIFAQAANAPLVYVAAQLAHGENVGIVVPDASSLQTLNDLKGKRIAVAKGSSGHDLLVAALESVHLTYTDVVPVYLAPADAAAAFATGAVHAWSIWDPFLAVAQSVHKARRLPMDQDVSRQSAFFLANRGFLTKHPKVIAAINEDIATVARYAQSHRDEATTLFAAATGVPLEAEKLAVSRTDFTVVPVSDEIVRQQQAVADRFARIKLIPERIDVSTNIWPWHPEG